MFFWKTEQFIKIRNKKGNFWGLVFPFCTLVLKLHWYIIYFLIWNWLFIKTGHNKVWEIINITKENPKDIVEILFVGIVVWLSMTLICLVSVGFIEGKLIKDIQWYLSAIKLKKINKKFWKCLFIDIIHWFNLKMLFFIYSIYLFTIIGLEPMTAYMESNPIAESIICSLGYVLITLRVIKDIIVDINEEKRVNVKNLYQNKINR